MSDLAPEAKILRDRLSRYPEHSREDLNKILKIVFEFVQLLDRILRMHVLDAQLYEVIARLEESRTWAGLSVKRGQQVGYKPSDYPLQRHTPTRESESVESSFDVVLNTILSRCVPNREMDLALSRLDEARAALNLEAPHCR